MSTLKTRVGQLEKAPALTGANDLLEAGRITEARTSLP